MSGRQAISQSRCDEERGPLRGVRGLYTLVFDDTESSSLLAYFTPTGKACCYYQSGAIRMISSSKGGALYSEVRDRDGYTPEMSGGWFQSLSFQI